MTNMTMLLLFGKRQLTFVLIHLINNLYARNLFKIFLHNDDNVIVVNMHVNKFTNSPSVWACILKEEFEYFSRKD